MEARHIVAGFTDEMVVGEVVAMKIESIKIASGVPFVKWRALPKEELRDKVVDLSQGYDYQKEKGLILSNILIADVLKEIAARLESIDDALRNTVEGSHA